MMLWGDFTRANRSRTSASYMIRKEAFSGIPKQTRVYLYSYYNVASPRPPNETIWSINDYGIGVALWGKPDLAEDVGV
ncbi:hypothetical protein LINPERPRIM_LOCUS30799 [Linum perenne]